MAHPRLLRKAARHTSNPIVYPLLYPIAVPLLYPIAVLLLHPIVTALLPGKPERLDDKPYNLLLTIKKV